MKRRLSILKVIPALGFLYSFANLWAQVLTPCETGGQTCYFAVETNGILSGYSVETYCPGVFEGINVRYEYSDVTLKMSLLGADIDAGFKVLYIFDQANDKALKAEVSVINGKVVLEFSSRISGDTIFFECPASGINKSIPVSGDVIFASQTRYPHLFRDFIMDGIKEKSYRVYDPLRGEVVEKGYVRKEEENVVLSDSIFKCLVLEETDNSTGVRSLLWLNRDDGFNVKAELPGRIICLTDKSVTGRITFANLDQLFFARVGTHIPEFYDLKWLRVKTRINIYGEVVSAASLNVPGQKFEGTVNGSLIDGIFEIEPVRYNGRDAPPFPPDFREMPAMEKYLAPEAMIESDDPLVVAEAARITKGSKDSWEALIRLSTWVAKNIAGALPGGISAINTLRTQEAECGGHSRLLTAFCRSVGIPARLATGCMYTNYYSGGFGQHAWTEIYMGDAGWIPVDATISEFDYIDAGHIRLGETTSFRPVSMEILGHRIGSSGE